MSLFLTWRFCLPTQLWGGCFLFLSLFYLSIVGLAPLASHFLAPAPKSNPPPHIVCPSGSWIYAYCLRAHFDAPSGRTRLLRREWLILPTNSHKFSKRRGGGFQKKNTKTSGSSIEALKDDNKKMMVTRTNIPVQLIHRFRLWPISTLGKPFRDEYYHESSGPAVWAVFASSGPAW